MAEIRLSDIANGTGGFVINGRCGGDESGARVANAGDFNGDGLTDVVVSTPYGSAGGGHTYIVFGGFSGSAIELSDVAAGTDGFVITDEDQDDNSGTAIAAAGDVNGDGLMDLLLGAPRHDPGNGNAAGRTYVVFGNSAPPAILDLSTIAAGTGGFVINGQCAGDFSGQSAASAGDVNGDGLADFIIGAFGADPAAGSQAGRAYVVFGTTTGSDIDLSAVAAGTGGFVINGLCEDERSGFGVAGLGDFNGDGLSDLSVGSNELAGIARTFVVFGKSTGQEVHLSDIAAGTGGFSIDGRGPSVSGAGDVNGDGLADVIVGAPHAPGHSESDAGRTYVVFGRSDGSTADVFAVEAGTGGFVIFGECGDDHSGESVAHAGDVNGDGLADLIIGAPQPDVLHGKTGRSYVVFGTTDTSAVELSDVATGTGGFLIQGQGSDDRMGYSVASAGDVNGDGLADLIVGAYRSDPGGRDLAGRSYVIFGSTTGAFDPSAVDQLGDETDETLTGTSDAETLVGGAGDDVLIGNGGADVLYGGAGDDSLVLDGDNVAALSAPFDDGGNDDRLSRVDGGTGLDTLALAGSGIALDLTLIADQGASTPGSASRIESIEQIDLTGSGDNALTLVVGDIVDLAGMNLINATTKTALGWTDGSDGGGTYTFAASEARHQLIVSGDTGDDINLADGTWDNVGTATRDGETYAVYNSIAGPVQVLLSNALSHNLQAAHIELADVEAGTGGFVIYGECATDFSGISVAGAGDVNGDGLDDLIVGAHGADSVAGRSYVVFGRGASGPIDLSAIAAGSGGFVIRGECAGDYSGFSVAGAGDVNGDGLADLIVGAKSSYPDNSGGSDLAGRSYVVFGRSGGTAVELTAVTAGTGGFVINGQGQDDYSGVSVAGAGDVNGDGLADVIVGAYKSDPGGAGRREAGRSYVVFGKAGTTAVNLSAIAAGSGGFVMNGEGEYDYSGASVAGAGDVNGDGLADLIVGAPENPYDYDHAGSGRSYVVFGRNSGGSINLSAIALGSGGFAINGQDQFDASGYSVAGAGDVNGDGLADLIVGAYKSSPYSGDYAGRSYVVFGKTTGGAVELSAVAQGTGGFVINGQHEDDASGTSVAGAGDVNGDGLADLIIGADYANAGAGFASGRSYVVFGKSTTGAIELSAVAASAGGFVVNGQGQSDHSGSSVAAAGDVNGDGLADLIIGAAGSDSFTGRSYVILGSTAGGFVATAVDQLGTAGADTLTGSAQTETLIGGAGNDTLIGNGGADVLYGGAGNDTFILNGSNAAALSAALGAGGNLGQLARLDGGGGLDVVMLSGSGVTLNLTATGQGGSASRLESIERVDLTGSGNNTFIVGLANLQDMLSASGVVNTLRVDGNAGDRVTFANAGSAAVSLSGGYHRFVRGGVTLEVNELIAITLAGSNALSDVLTGTARADTLLGLDGNDTLIGNAGDDTLNGGNGSDTASYASAAAAVNVDLSKTARQNTGGAGSDTLTGVENLIGSSRNDTLTGNGGANTLTGGNGNDKLVGGAGVDTAAYAGTAAVTVSLAVTAAQKTGGAGTDTLSGIENLTGGNGNDRLTGNDLANVLSGGNGNDTLSGGKGNDVLDGGIGNDSLTGGAGNDTYVINVAADKVIEGAAGGGTDLVQSTASYSLAANAENLTLLGTANLNGTGNASANALTGNTGANRLSGGAGNDVLKGLAGADTLTGGAGADRFDFDAVTESGLTPAARDQITDFSRTQNDKIDLSTIDANEVLAGNNAFTFIGGNAFDGVNASGQLRFDAATHVLLGSTDADAAAEFSILLPNSILGMAGTDFIL